MKLTDLAPHVRAKVAALLPEKPKRKRGMNRWERAFMEKLQAESARPVVRFEDVTLRLGHDCRYTPDLIAVTQDGADWRVEAFEIKGFRRDDAMVKLRVAAREYPWITFHLVERAKGGEWKISEIER